MKTKRERESVAKRAKIQHKREDIIIVVVEDNTIVNNKILIKQYKSNC